MPAHPKRFEHRRASPCFISTLRYSNVRFWAPKQPARYYESLASSARLPIRILCEEDSGRAFVFVEECTYAAMIGPRELSLEMAWPKISRIDRLQRSEGLYKAALFNA